MPQDNFPFGLRIFLRTTTANGDLHNVLLPKARSLVYNPNTITIEVLDEDKTTIGFFLHSAIAFILPLSPPEPLSDAKN